MFQAKVWKMREYFVYFPFFTLPAWGKRSGENRRSHCVVLPKYKNKPCLYGKRQGLCVQKPCGTTLFAAKGGHSTAVRQPPPRISVGLRPSYLGVSLLGAAAQRPVYSMSVAASHQPAVLCHREGMLLFPRPCVYLIGADYTMGFPRCQVKKHTSLSRWDTVTR